MLLTLLPVAAFAGETTPAVGSITEFDVVNPYENVDWDTYGRYRAALHIHTTRSDGSASVAETVLDLYNKGFDIIAITDHDVTHGGDWADGEPGALTVSQRDAIIDGTFGRTEYTDAIFPGDFNNGELFRPQTNGMISIPFTNEQSRTEHINTFWADFNNESGWNQTRILEETTAVGGLAIFNHPGRYTTGAGGGAGGVASSNNPMRISYYVEMFDRFDVALGFELFNRLDNESRSDRVLWDNVLYALMPYGRFVWGFSNDDSHSMNQAGYNFNVLLMPELDADYARGAMEGGAFYMVTRMNRGVGPTDPEINTTLPGGGAAPNGGTAATLFMLEQTTPSIANIEVDGNTITIAGNDYDLIQWIADGAIIYEGTTLDLVEMQDYITRNYVRAQLISEYGQALTQPFGILPAGEDFEERPDTDNLASIDPVRAINAEFGAEPTVAGFRLPATVTVVSDRTWRAAASVEWDLSGVTLEPDVAQTLTIPGVVTLPEGWTNTNDVLLEVTVTVNYGVDPVISIAAANATALGEPIIVEGFVTAGRLGGGGGPDIPNIVIQDSMEAWGGLWVHFPVAAGATLADTHGNIGYWVRVIGVRGVQWGENNSIVASSVERLELTEEELAERPTIEPVELTLADLPLGTSGQWNNMLVSITAPLVQRNNGVDGQAELHLIRSPEEGRVEIAAAGAGVLPLWVQDGAEVYVDRAIVHWRADLESHRLHANWAGVDGSIRSTEPFPFTDVADGFWGRDYIWFVYNHGIMLGTGGTLFEPYTPLDRAMLATMLWRVAGEPETEYRPVFSDVADGQWYSEAIVWAYDNDVVRGIGGGLFAPDVPITRQEIATMLARFADGEAPEDFVLNFPDADQVSDWALEGVRWANYQDILRGTGEGNLEPTGTAIRAHGAAFLARFMALLD